MTGNLLDESDSGPNSDATQFEFTGAASGFTIDTGIFTPTTSKKPAEGDPNTILNFLVGASGDAPNLDFKSAVVATLNGTNSNAIEHYFTRYGTSPSVQKVEVTYDGTLLNIASPITVTRSVTADGTSFLPDGRLVVANGQLSFINPLTGTFTSVNGLGAEHLALDPGGTKIWTSPQPGSLVEIPLASSANGIVHAITGDDTVVTQLAFDTQGTAYYTTGSPFGFGNFGTIDLTTFTAKRYLTNLPGAHGIIFDHYTGDLCICGFNHII